MKPVIKSYITLTSVIVPISFIFGGISYFLKDDPRGIKLTVITLIVALVAGIFLIIVENEED